MKDKVSEDDFSSGMARVGGKALKIAEEYFDGDRQGTDMVNAALNFLGKAVAVRQQDRLSKQIERSQNIRIGLGFLTDPEAKKRYIAAMHPELTEVIGLPKPEVK